MERLAVEFERTHAWTTRWGLVEGGIRYEDVVEPDVIPQRSQG